ncbi:MAG: endospore germination permease [Syntrophomonadaceae bacterium]|jgi:spore germination protein KB|nr:endospore germination permease [Syntrophomonadaceae bacterium]
MLEKGKISSFQLSVLLAGFVLGSSVIIIPGGDAGHDAWIAIALGLMEGLFIAWIFTALVTRFKDKTIIEINDLVFGRILGKLISILFVWYFFHLGALVLNDYVHFFRLQLYPATPKTIMLLILMLVCASTVNRGIEVLARCSLILVPFTIGIILIDTMFLIPQIDLNNLMPILDVPIGNLLLAAHSAASFPFAETVAFVMILAFLNKSEKGGPAVSKGLILAGLVLIIASVRNNAVLGPMTAAYNYPSYQTVQAIDIGEILTRVEILVAINFITMGFLKISVLLYGTVLGLSQVLNLKSYRPIILPVGILMVLLALTNVGNTIELFEFSHNSYPIYAVPFQIIIPLIALMVVKLRKMPKAEGGKP